MTGWKFHHLKRYSLLKMGDFPGCHVSFQGWTRMSQEPSKRLGSVGYFTPTKTPFIGRLKKPFTNHVMMTSWNIPSMSHTFRTEKKSWPNWSHIPREAHKATCSSGKLPCPPRRKEGGRTFALRVFFTWDTEKKERCFFFFFGWSEYFYWTMEPTRFEPTHTKKKTHTHKKCCVFKVFPVHEVGCPKKSSRNIILARIQKWNPHGANHHGMKWANVP